MKTVTKRNRGVLDTRTVLNNRFERVIRSFSYLLILVSGVILSVTFLNKIEWNKLTDLIEPVTTFINKDLKFFEDYNFLILIVGLLGLVWTQSRNMFLKIFTTIITLLVVLISDNLTGFKVLTFIPDIKIIENLFQDVKVPWLIYAIQFIPILLIYIVFSLKKPRRNSLNLVISGLGFMILLIAALALPVILSKNWDLENVYKIAKNSIASLSFVLLTFGSLFGLLGFFRR